MHLCTCAVIAVRVSVDSETGKHILLCIHVTAAQMYTVAFPPAPWATLILITHLAKINGMPTWANANSVNEDKLFCEKKQCRLPA